MDAFGPFVDLNADAFGPFVDVDVAAFASNLDEPLVLPPGFENIPHPGFAHMPLSAVNIRHGIGPVTGRPILRVTPRFPDINRDTKFYMATQHRDQSRGKRFIIAGFMPLVTIRRWLAHLHGSGQRDLKTEICVTNQTEKTAMFCISDVPSLASFGPVMPRDMAEGLGWNKDPTMAELMARFGKPGKKKEKE